MVENQASLRTEILPAVIASIGTLRQGVAGASDWVTGKAQAVADAVGGFLGSVANVPLLGWADGALQWLRERVYGVAATISGGVRTVFTFVGAGLTLFERFAQPVLDTLLEMVSVAGDLLGRLGSFVAGTLGGWIPRCLRDQTIRELSTIEGIGASRAAVLLRGWSNWTQIENHVDDTAGRRLFNNAQLLALKNRTARPRLGFGQATQVRPP